MNRCSFRRLIIGVCNEYRFIVRLIKSRRIAWLGRVMRMDEKRTPKRILEWKNIGTRIRGRDGL